jgi:eukaryotic-like serine/threonine-protein kinase
MALGAGTCLGNFEILAPLGAGGMGEVYRARDSKLGREVAIKVLPDSLAQDEERLARFAREAKLLASLNHPNIATLHGLEEWESKPFLVMELVEGETLAERLKRGPIPIEEALPLFIGIAEGLEAAHEKGIIHRDLKPANIKIGPNGKPKVLDFGLATVLADPIAQSDLAESPTITKGTAVGVILGTAHYMSPEQARGRPVDKRTDVWAFGCILYETLAGRKAFTGEQVTDVLASILKAEPDWNSLAPDLPTHVSKLLRRCLAKDRESRLRDIGDAILELRDSTLSENLPVGSLRPRRMASVRIFLMGVLLGGLVVLGLHRSERDEDSKLAVRFSISVPSVPIGTRSGDALNISPDGRHVAYVGLDASGSSVIYLRDLNTMGFLPISGSRGVTGWPFFSHDGQWLAFFDRNGLARVPIDGGTPQRVLAGAAQHVGMHWGEDGYIYFPSTYLAPIQRIRPDGGDPEPVTELADGDMGHWWPYLLPGGKSILYTVYAKGSLDDWEIRIHDLSTRKSAALIRGGYNARYVPSGHIVYGHSGGLMAVPFDLARLKIAGDPSLVIANVATNEFNAGMKLAVSDNGTLVFAEESREDELVWAGLDGQERAATTEKGNFEFPRVSPDGTRVAFVMGDGVNRSIRVVDLTRGAITRLTFGHADTSPVWSPDGATLYFSSESNGPMEIFRVPSNGEGEPELVRGGAVDKFVSSISPDGRWLAFVEDNPGDQPGSQDVKFLSLESGEVLPFATSPFSEVSPAFSANGEWIAYASNESGRYEVYLRPSNGHGGKIQISTEGGASPVWSRTENMIYFWNQQRIVSVSVPRHPTSGLGRPIVLFDARQFRGGQEFIPSFDAGLSGDLVMVRTQQDARRGELNVVLNWFDELKRLVPTGK